MLGVWWSLGDNFHVKYFESVGELKISYTLKFGHFQETWLSYREAATFQALAYYDSWSGKVL